MYRLLFVHALILMVGGHYTYAKVPLGFWVQDALGLARNTTTDSAISRRASCPRCSRARSPAPLAAAARQVARSSSSCASASRVSATYELIEWLAAVLGGSAADAFLGTQGDVWDTQWDMFMALVGAITALLMLSRIHDRQLARLGRRLRRERRHRCSAAGGASRGPAR